jgi:phosphatidylglycerophosphatase A
VNSSAPANAPSTDGPSTGANAPSGGRPSLAVLVAGSAFGAGYAPVASGTVGSAVALAIAWFVPWLHDGWILLAASVAVTLAGIPIAARMERFYGRDPAEVVIDEVAGQWISLLFLPHTWQAALAAFLFFRAFDIVKPPPARYFDRMHGGFGIMMDDVIAGLYALACSHLLLRFI